MCSGQCSSNTTESIFRSPALTPNTKLSDFTQSLLELSRQPLSILEKCSRQLSFFRVQPALFFTITLRATPRQVEKIVNSRNDSNKPANYSAFTSSITSSSERTTDTTVLLMRDSSPASLPHSFYLPFVLPETTLTKWSLLTDIEEGMISGVVGRGIRSTEATIGGPDNVGNGKRPTNQMET